MENKAKMLKRSIRLAVSGSLLAASILPLVSHAGGLPINQVSSMAGQAMAMSPVKPVPVSALPGGSMIMSAAMACMPTAMGLASKLNQMPSLPGLPSAAALPTGLPNAGTLPTALPTSLPNATALPTALPAAGKLPTALPSTAALPSMSSLPNAMSGMPGVGSLPAMLGASPLLKVGFYGQTPVATASGCGHASLSQFGLCVSANSLLGSLHLSASGRTGFPAI